MNTKRKRETQPVPVHSTHTHTHSHEQTHNKLRAAVVCMMYERTCDVYYTRTKRKWKERERAGKENKKCIKRIKTDWNHDKLKQCTTDIF